MADATKTEDEYFREHEHHFEAETQRWRAAQTIEQVGGFFADWFDGKSWFLPSYLSPQPGPETTQAPGFTTLLSRLNRAGWLMTCSRPGEPVEVDDNEQWEQCEAIDLVLDDDQVQQIQSAVAGTALVVFSDTIPDEIDYGETIVVTRSIDRCA